MKTNLLTTCTALVVLFLIVLTGCKKEETNPTENNPDNTENDYRLDSVVSFNFENEDSIYSRKSIYETFASGFFSKPAPIRELLAKIEVLLNPKEEKQELPSEIPSNTEKIVRQEPNERSVVATAIDATVSTTDIMIWPQIAPLENCSF